MKTLTQAQARDQGYHLQMTNECHIKDDRDIIKSMESNLGPIGCVWVVFPKLPHHVLAYAKRDARPMDSRSVKLQPK